MSARLARSQVIQSTVYVLLRITDPSRMLGPPPSVRPLRQFVRQSVSLCPSVYQFAPPSSLPPPLFRKLFGNTLC